MDQPANNGQAPPSKIIPTGVPHTALYRPIAICAALLLASAIIFASMPALDLWASGWFYSPASGFYLGKTWPIVGIRDIGIAITVTTIIALIAVGLWWQARPQSMALWPSATPRADWIFVTLGLLVGPGLIVNLIFKPIWGRARPVHIEQFGGTDHFTPAWVIAHQCQWNCSFFSGEAAATAFNLALCLVTPPRWRTAAFIAAAGVTLAVSFARMAAGGHFLSDVVTAWLMMVLILLVLHAQVYHGLWLGPLKRFWPIR